MKIKNRNEAIAVSLALHVSYTKSILGEYQEQFSFEVIRHNLHESECIEERDNYQDALVLAKKEADKHKVQLFVQNAISKLQPSSVTLFA
tara:strand:- start:4840 stop:5109 length:270 start_codon:yes stop_codon:yes gene_type:complete